MADVLENKRSATRFRILVEIAERQPAVSQGEIAEAVGVTSQAVSEYIRELVEEDLVVKEGRSRYRVTKEGVDLLLRDATEVRRFVDHVTEDVLGSVQEDAAIATAALSEGEDVTLTLQDGLLHAGPGTSGDATGVTTTDADAGQDVGVTGFEGVIDLDAGSVTVLQIPPIRSGGSRTIDDDLVTGNVAEADLIVAAGVEAVVALRRNDVEPATAFAAGQVAAAAAGRGLDVLAASTTDAVGRVTDALRDADVAYEVTEAR